MNTHVLFAPNFFVWEKWNEGSGGGFSLVFFGAKWFLFGLLFNKYSSKEHVIAGVLVLFAYRWYTFLWNPKGAFWREREAKARELGATERVDQTQGAQYFLRFCPITWSTGPKVAKEPLHPAGKGPVGASLCRKTCRDSMLIFWSSSRRKMPSRP